MRDNLTGQLKYLVETLYYSVGTGELERALPVYREWLQTFPLDGVAHNNYAVILLYLGRFDESAAETREAIRLMPSLGTGAGNYTTLMTATALAGRLEEAKAVFGTAQTQNFDRSDQHRLRLRIALVEHDETAMDEQFRWAEAHKDWDMLLLRAEGQAYAGRLKDANRWTKKVMDLAPKPWSTSEHRSFYLRTGMMQTEVGMTADARRSAIGPIQPTMDKSYRLQLALLLARAEEPARAETLAEGINREAPSDTIIQKFSLPTIRAAIKLARGDAQGAVDILRPAEEYDLVYTSSFDNAYPAYFRELAYLRLGQGGLAVEQFQKLLAHPILVGFTVGHSPIFNWDAPGR